MIVGDKFKYGNDDIIYTVNNITNNEIEISFEGETATYSIKEFDDYIKPSIIKL